jgi:dipeptidyl aminopeptidase/acylaminoacyl peptidase
LLVIGGPDCFDGIGRNIGEQPVANSYDQQLFIFDPSNGNVVPLTRNFNPSVQSAIWHPVNRKIYITADDQMYTRIFEYDTRSKVFKQLNTVPEVVTSFSMSGNLTKAAYVGNNLASPPRAWIIDIPTGQSTLFDQTESDTYKNVTFGKPEEWNFVKSDGTTIRGYFIYPMNFDPGKKYPLIVNYYGGVTPVEKSFGGRYPQDIWACEGYAVYVPEPSGAVGFGQEFSARHQNNWGLTVADEIIEGTKKFIAAHPFVDTAKVGCIGASYGGFMTMLLITKTNMFACAISHAGISSISSYWGEGYWGYWYNTVASLGSYPWNRKDLYVGQSPLFSADKITTPLLLLHGSADVNVPLGESLQLWVGLKILGRPVEMVQIEGEDHHILTYSKRIEWHNTIMAWFDKWLKDKDHDWKKLFP